MDVLVGVSLLSVDSGGDCSLGSLYQHIQEWDLVTFYLFGELD